MFKTVPFSTCAWDAAVRARLWRVFSLLLAGMLPYTDSPTYCPFLPTPPAPVHPLGSLFIYLAPSADQGLPKNSEARYARQEGVGSVVACVIFGDGSFPFLLLLLSPKHMEVSD